MAHVLIKHRVKDYSEWKKIFDGYYDNRKTAGEQSFNILHPENDPTDLTLLFEWNTQNNARTFLESAETKDAMQKAGVTEEPTIVFLNQADEGKL